MELFPDIKYLRGIGGERKWQNITDAYGIIL